MPSSHPTPPIQFPLKPTGGRPPKFAEPSRAITVTLPERVLARLESIHPDRAMAIVTAVDADPQGGADADPVQVVEIQKGQGLILVGPSRALRSISWLSLVQIAPSRFLLVLPPGTPIEMLEVAVSDLLERDGDLDDREKSLLVALRNLVARLRRASAVTKAELLFVNTRQ